MTFLCLDASPAHSFLQGLWPLKILPTNYRRVDQGAGPVLPFYPLYLTPPGCSPCFLSLASSILPAFQTPHFISLHEFNGFQMLPHFRIF